MLKNILKIVFLGVVGFAGLVYLTAPENITNEKNVKKSFEQNIKYFPRFFDVISNKPYTKFEEIFDLKKEQYLIILNHDSLNVFDELYKYSNKNIVLVANISNTPWLIKELAVNDKLQELYKDSTIPLIIDSNGAIKSVLSLNDSTQNRYFVYKIEKNGDIKKVSDGLVKLNSLEKGITKEEKNKALEEISKSLLF